MLLEHETVEFKREYTEDIKYAVVAFANSNGGTLYIGINDDGSLCGVEDADETMLRVTNKIRDTIRPDITMFIHYKIDVIDDKKIIVITVQRGTARPYYLAGKGVRPEGVYIRQGASSVPASETAILNMIKETSGDCYEDARSLNQQLTFTTTEAYFEKKEILFGEQQKRTLHIIGSDGTYTNLGLLLSDQCTHTMKLAVFDGSKKTVFRDRRALTGSLLKQLEEAYTYIDQFNRTRAEFFGLDRIDMRDYPPEALREALLNAIVHRDYAISGSTLISIFDDRIEFVTIGGLVPGITLDDIMLGVSVSRNQHLADVFYRLKLIEAYGTGMLKINECYADYIVKPKIEISNHAFKITLPNTNYLDKKELTSQRPNQKKRKRVERTSTAMEREVRVMQMLDERESITRKDVEIALQVSQATAILTLNRMVQNGTLKKIGTGKKSRYGATEKNSNGTQ